MTDTQDPPAATPDRPSIPECLNDACTMGCTTECRAVINAAWRRLNPAAAERHAQQHAGHGSPCETSPEGSCAARAPAALREEYAVALYAHGYGTEPTGDTWRGTKDSYLAAADAVRAVSDRELEQLRARVRHVAHLIECGAPWTASRADTAARVRDAVGPEKPAAAPAVPPQHIGNGANAEDCPACSGTNLPYPWVCPGETS